MWDMWEICDEWLMQLLPSARMHSEGTVDIYTIHIHVGIANYWTWYITYICYSFLFPTVLELNIIMCVYSTTKNHPYVYYTV